MGYQEEDRSDYDKLSPVYQLYFNELFINEMIDPDEIEKRTELLLLTKRDRKARISETLDELEGFKVKPLSAEGTEVEDSWRNLSKFLADGKFVNMVLTANCGKKLTKAFRRLNKIVEYECLQKDPEAMRCLEEGGEEALEIYRFKHEMPDEAKERVNMIAERLRIGGTGQYGFYKET